MKSIQLFLLTLFLTFFGNLGINAQQAYCALQKTEASDGSLYKVTATLFYDNLRNSRSETIDFPTAYAQRLAIPTADFVHVIFDSSFKNFKPQSTSYWFYWLQARVKVSFDGWENLNTSQVTIMDNMFYALGHYETNEGNKTCMVENLDLSHFDTSNVTDMRNLLNYACVDSVNLSNFTFKPGVKTTGLLGNTNINRLVIPIGATNWADDACNRLVGIDEPSCKLFYPDGIFPNATLSDNLVVNGDCEGSSMTCLKASQSSITVSDADILNGIGFNGSKGVKVHADENDANQWDSQFFVYTPDHTWKKGDNYRFSMKVKADVPATVFVQAHGAPSAYMHYEMLGTSEFNITSEWQEFTYEGTISSEQDGMQTITFNLSKLGQSNNFYFDDISWQPIEVNENGSSFIWKGGHFKVDNSYAVLSKDRKTLTFYNDNDKQSHVNEGQVFRLNTGEDYPKWREYTYSITDVVIDESFSNDNAMNLSEYVFQNIGSVDNPCKLSCPEGIVTTPYFATGDFKGSEIVIKTHHHKDNDLRDASPINGVGVNGSKGYMVTSYAEAEQLYDTEFLVTTPNHVWKTGDRFRFKMKVRADKETKIHVHSQKMPTECLYFVMLEGSYDITTEWQEIEYEGTISDKQAGSSGMQTISFLVNELKEVINFYFDDISWEPLYTNSNGDDYVVWKKGFLTLPPKPETYAVLSQDETALTIYHDKDRKSHIGEVTIYRISLKETPGWSNCANNITKVELTPSFINSGFANQLPDNSFYGVGTAAKPSFLYYPAGFTPQNVSEGSGYLEWKAGYFKTAQAYAVLSSDKKTLTFYCDDKRSVHNSSSSGENVYSLNSLKTGVAISSIQPGWCTATINGSSVRENIENVAFDESFAHYHPITTSYWFYGMTKLTNITHLDYLKTDLVVDFALMFSSCRQLTSVDVSHFDTRSAKSLTSMFNGCSSLKNIDVSHFDDSNIPSGYGVNSMFAHCTSLENLDLSNFVFSGTNNGGMVMYCTSLKTLKVSASANKLTDGGTFNHVGSADSPCRLIYAEDFTPSDTTWVDGYFNWKGGSFIDRDAYALIYGDNMTLYFDNQYEKRFGATYLLDLNEDYDLPRWHRADGTETLTEVVFDDSFSKARPRSCRGWFYYFTNLTTIKNIENLNTSKVANMSAMFLFCDHLESLNLSSFDTSNVTDMSYMFDGCYSMTTLSGLNFDTSKVTDMSYMFDICSALTSLDISNFSFIAQGTYNNMLTHCNALQTLTIPISANFMSDEETYEACSGVGTAEKPCILVVPENFVYDGAVWDASHSYFTWRGGYFKNAKMGDANGDDKVTVADVMLTVNAILGKGHTTFIKKIADVNKDNKITVSDVMGIVKIVLGSH